MNTPYTDAVAPSGYTNGQFEQLYQQHYTYIHLHIYYIVNDWERAHDLTQTTFEKAWTAREKAQVQGTGFQYFKRIATNTALDALRRDRAWRYTAPCMSSLDHDEDAWMLASSLEEPYSDPAEHYEEPTRASRTLATMPHHYRAIICLVAEGYKPREITPLFGVTPKTIWWWLAWARELFKQRYSKAKEQEGEAA